MNHLEIFNPFCHFVSLHISWNCALFRVPLENAYELQLSKPVADFNLDLCRPSEMVCKQQSYH
jgi:hypothetical protein